LPPKRIPYAQRKNSWKTLQKGVVEITKLGIIWNFPGNAGLPDWQHKKHNFSLVDCVNLCVRMGKRGKGKMERNKTEKNCHFPFSHFSVFPFPYTYFVPLKDTNFNTWLPCE
jgi:hypothetical protein